MLRAIRTRFWGAAAVVAGVLAQGGSQAVAQPSGLWLQAAISRQASTSDAHGAARSKLLQARAYLGQGNFDLADSAVNEVNSMNLSYSASEDSPAKVMQDIEKAKSSPQTLLSASRAALLRKDYNLAERYARDADRLSGTFTFPKWGDNPSKVMEEIKTARRLAPPAVAKYDEQPIVPVRHQSVPRHPVANDPAPIPTKPPVARELPPTQPVVVERKQPAPVVQPPIQQVKHTAPVPPPIPEVKHTAPVKDDRRAEAKTKLAHARSQLAQYNFVVAEGIAREVAGMKLTFGSGEDSPTKVLQDVLKGQNDPKALLQASRVALGRKDYAQAETYAKQAQAKANLLTFAGFGDTPAKALKDIEVARKPAVVMKKDAPVPAPRTTLVKGEETPKTPAVKAQPTGSAKGNSTEVPVASPKPVGTAKGSDAEKARATMKQARAALDAGKYDEARSLSSQARAMNVSLGWWEENPDKLEADLRRAESNVPKSGSASKVTASTSDLPRNKEAARTLLNRGRKEMAEGNLDKAFATAQNVKAARDLNWGLFEDSPDRLLGDIDKARVSRDKAEADRLLAEGRKLYEKGDYEQASKLAYRAQKLGGTYSIWDLGDRPSKLLADVQTAQARNRKTDLPPSTVARKDEKKGEPAVAPAPKQSGTAVVQNTPAPKTVTPPANTPTKLQAQQLVAESQRLLREGNLIEARQKAVEAQRLNVAFAADEITPELVYQQVTTEVRSRTDRMMREANEVAANGVGDAVTRFRNAEARLIEAKTLAANFGQDVRPIDEQVVQLRRLRDASSQPAPVSGSVALTNNPVPPPPAPVTQGPQLLDKARLELQKGETKMARRMCEQALTSKQGDREEAIALLRTIDAEEFEQTRRTANRTFDAAVSAYNRRDHSQASTLIAAIDIRLLSPDRQSRLREMALTPAMKPVPIGVAQATDTRKPGVTVPPPPMQGTIRPVAGSDQPGSVRPIGEATGKAVATDKGDELDRYKARQKILHDKLRKDLLDVQAAAGEKVRAGQHDSAIVMLQEFAAALDIEQLDANQLSPIKRQVEARISQYKLLASQRALVEGSKTRRVNGLPAVEARMKAEELKQKNVEKLMKDFNRLYKEGKYVEAESMAARAYELDPDNSMTVLAVELSKRSRAVLDAKNLKQDKAEYVRRAMNDAERPGAAGAIESGIAIDREVMEKNKKRVQLDKFVLDKKTEAQKSIERKLSTPVRISFDNAPLKSVLQDLSDYHGVNIVPDLPAMQEAGVSLDSPVSIKLDQVSLKSALNLILHQVKLTHVIKDEVLNVTTEEHARAKMIAVTYPVQDLVIPVENFGDLRNNNISLIGQPQQAEPYAPTPVTGPNSLIGGTSVGSPSGQPTASAGGTTVTKNAPTRTLQDQLIRLVTGTIRPQTWSEMGGPGTIEYHPLTMALVINQAPDIQEQIQDLLASLRRLQDQEVAVEVRFITVSEDFFERIGVNFNVNILTDTKKHQPALLNNAFVQDPVNFINSFRPGSFLAGATPAGTLTPTLDIPITNSSFFQTVPAFGNYVPGGGLSLGLAFLSDIQVFLFLEAVQGDVRTNLMQAPKLTLFNGQTSTIQVGASQPMITGVQVASPLNAVGGAGFFALVPQISPIPVGGNVSLTIQAVISADRRFVRLSLQPIFQSIRPGPIQVTPIAVPLFSSIDGAVTSQPVVFTQFLAQPVQTFVSVQTTVAVPDGGTVLLGGLKQLSEERSEYGPPILSKIPYINRLFKNVGYGRSTDSLLIMVTPRIIIQEEEEQRATGFAVTPAINP